MATSLELAKRHVYVSTQIKRMAESRMPSGHVYVATHALRRYKLTYGQAEEDSGEEFWSIKAWAATTPKTNLKDPDVIITEESRVRFFIEVKWGSVTGAETDLNLRPKERKEIVELLNAQRVYCHVNGPMSAPTSGRRLLEIWLDDQTRFLLVTDISDYPRLYPFLDLWKDAGLEVADIKRPIRPHRALPEIFADLARK